ncbi:MAG: ATP-binding cassette domain-containing protein [Thiolinea sp.]
MGRVSGEADPRQETAKSLAEMMIGKELPVCDHPPAEQLGEERLVIQQLSRPSADPFGTSLQDINLVVRGGEIVGIAGVSGNGQQELLYALSGEKPSKAAEADQVRINGQPAAHLRPAQRRKLGLRFVPEERLGRGAVPQMSLTLNALLTGHDAGMSRSGLIRYGAMRRFARDCIERFGVKTSGAEAEAKSLSGGNVQKYIVGRELMLQPEVLIVSQPTWGVDVGAAGFIRQTLIDLRNEGVAILVVSEELDELFEICDCIAVISAGQLSPPRPARETSREDIGLLMGGLGQREPTQPAAAA